MSASLFYDCYASYESYPDTKYASGDKKFCEVKEGDVLYRLDSNNNISELTVRKPFHVTKGRCIISVNGRGNNIDFGTSRCSNVWDARDMSIVFYNNYSIIGTNKKSIVKIRIDKLTNELNKVKNQYEHLETELNELNNML